MVRFRRAVAPLREVIGELLRKEADWVGPEALVRLKDVLDHSCACPTSSRPSATS